MNVVSSAVGPARLTSALGLALALALAAVACKKDPPVDSSPKDAAPTTGKVGVVASCDMTTVVGSCNEYAKLSMGLEKGLCQGLKGTFAEGAQAGCPTKDEVGRCTMSDGEVRHYYGLAVGAHGFTAADAEKDCVSSPEIGGKFSPAAP